MPTARRRARAVSAPFSIQWPTVVVVVLAVVATGLQVVNQQVLTSNPQWQGIIAVFLIFLVGVGISPLHGGAGLSTWLHIPPVVGLVIAAVVSALAGALQVVHMTPGAHTAVAAVLTFLAALGFGSSTPVALAAGK